MPLTMNPAIQLLVRDPQCSLCRLGSQATGKDVCVTAQGPEHADVMVVTKTPLSEKGRAELSTYLKRAGIDPESVSFTAANKCRAWDIDPSKTDQKACRPYLDREIEAIRPQVILALGNEAMYSLTGRSGIMKHRGVVTTRPDGARVFPTISPSMMYRNPGLKGGFEADLKYLSKMVDGTDNEDDSFEYRTCNTMEDLRELVGALKSAEVMAFDIETNGFDEFASDARMVSLAVTLATNDPAAPTTSWAVPLYHPESPWRASWRSVLKKLQPYIDMVPKAVGHNAKFDCRWLRQFGVKRTLTFDTMLAAHTLDENRPKGLKPLAQQLLGVKPWAISTKTLLETPIAEVLTYNALDTFHTLGLYRVFKDQFRLPENARKFKLFALIMMPCSEVFTDIEREGVWTDVEQMMTNWQIAQRELEVIDEELRTWVPEDAPYAVNFNPSNFARWFLFDHLGLPILARGKAKDDGTLGAPSMAEAIMMDLRDKHPHRVLDLMIERTKWVKYTTAFFSAYAEQVDDNDRIHTTFKLTGTVTGRLSSGKPDQDKVTGRKQSRGVNLQQVPRDNFVRGIFGAPPGSYFVEFDYSQVELRVAAFIARETTMLHLYATGQDIHMTMAQRMTGKPVAEITKEERKKAKAVNFGFLYGMGVLKFIDTAWSNYGVRVTDAESKAFRDAFFGQFPMLLRWHGRQRQLVSKYKRVESPLGRVRHLPDIDSPNPSVRSEAERQAINSPVQSFASDMCLLSMVRVTREFKRQGMSAHPIGTVHDAINWEIPAEEMSLALPMIKNGMQTLPLDRLFGINLDVPIIADCKVGHRWGGATELTEDQIYDWKPEYIAA